MFAVLNSNLRVISYTAIDNYYQDLLKWIPERGWQASIPSRISETFKFRKDFHSSRKHFPKTQGMCQTLGNSQDLRRSQAQLCLNGARERQVRRSGGDIIITLCQDTCLAVLLKTSQVYEELREKSHWSLLNKIQVGFTEEAAGKLIPCIFTKAPLPGSP